MISKVSQVLNIQVIMSVENIEEIEQVSLDLPLVYEDLCNMFENICKFYNRKMISKRIARGWKEIHEDILEGAGL